MERIIKPFTEVKNIVPVYAIIKQGGVSTMPSNNKPNDEIIRWGIRKRLLPKSYKGDRRLDAQVALALHMYYAGLFTKKEFREKIDCFLMSF